jgi:hypothetical protein
MTEIINYGPPIRIPISRWKRGTDLKVRRGGAISVNSGNAAGRYHIPNRAIRNVKDGSYLPWPARGEAIWNPRDPFIIAYREQHGTVP